MRKILGVFEVFLGIFEKTKEKKDREEAHSRRHESGNLCVVCLHPQGDMMTKIARQQSRQDGDVPKCCPQQNLGF